MGLFRKESQDIIDFTMLQKRGILKKETIKESPSRPLDTKTGFLDLTSPPTSTASTTPTSSSPQDIFGFLDASASSGNASPLPSPPSENTEVQSLKVKIDDLEFKLERLLEKLSAMESKLEK